MSQPLSAIAYETLSRLSSGPIPTQEVNPGLIDKLYREGLIALVQVASPYKSHKGEAEARRHAGEEFGVV